MTLDGSLIVNGSVQELRDKLRGELYGAEAQIHSSFGTGPFEGDDDNGVKELYALVDDLILAVRRETLRGEWVWLDEALKNNQDPRFTGERLTHPQVRGFQYAMTWVDMHASHPEVGQAVMIQGKCVYTCVRYVCNNGCSGTGYHHNHFCEGHR